MLTYSFEHLEGESLYEHLYRCIRGDILAGRLRAGEKLPSKRSLARQLGISVITVEGAYGQLVAEGYCQSVPKKGFFVVRVMGVPQESLRKAEPAAEREAPRPRYFADFTANSLPPADFPFKTWTRLLRQVIAGQPEALLERSPGMGILSLRATIAGHLRSFRGLDVTPGQIVIGAGTEYLYGLLVQLLGRGKCFGVENPGYDKIRKVYHRHGVDCVPVDMEEEGISLPDLQAKAVDVLHISPSHHFPTGCITPISRRYELLGWASAAPGRYIIEDDYDSEFRFTLRPIPTLQSIDRAGRVIYVNTFSRTLAPSLRISYMVLPKGLTERYRAQLGFYSSTVPAMEQHTLARFLDEGYFEAHINRMRKSYRAQRDAVIDTILQSPLGEHCRVSGEDAGLHFLLTIDTKCTDHVLRADAEGRGVRLSFLSDFALRPGSAPQHTLVIHYPGIDLGRLRSALSILEALLYFRDWKYKGRK